MSAPAVAESEWLWIAQSLSDAASEAAERAQDLSRRARECYERAGVAAPSAAAKADRILWNHGREVIDEIVIHDADTVHVEQLDDRCWWIGIYKGDLRWSGTFACYRHKDGMTFTEQDAELPWGRDEEHR